MLELWQIETRQQMPLNMKIKYSETRIKDWYEFYEGKVYISFSGGKTSQVLLNLVRNIYPEIPAVYIENNLDALEYSKFILDYEKKTERKPYLGIRANKSNLNDFLKNGCNAFELERPQSRPLSFWLDKDISEYLIEKNLI